VVAWSCSPVADDGGSLEVEEDLRCHRRSCCVPTTCAAQGVSCGTISNGCGGTLDCGTCPPPPPPPPTDAGADTGSVAGFATGQSHGITTRGHGPGSTFLRFSYSTAGGQGLVDFDGLVPWPAPTLVDWTAGYAKGSSKVTLSSVAGLSVGDMLVLDQLNDPDL